MLFGINIFFLFLTVDVFADNNDEILTLETNMMKSIEKQEFDKALVQVNEILKIDSENINALNNKGGILIELGLNVEAVDNFNRVLLIDQNNTKALNNKGIALIRQEKIPESFHAFYESLKIDPTNEIAFENMKKLTERMTWINESKNGYAVLTVRDENGNIVNYSKTNTIEMHLPLGYILLKDFGELEEVYFNGEKRILATYTNTQTMKHNQFIGVIGAKMGFGDNSLQVIEMEINGLIAKAGDNFTYEIAVFLPRT